MQAVTLKNVYTPKEFGLEVLHGHRSYDWIIEQCKKKKIKTVTTRPYLIPQSEALRFISPK